MHRSRVGPRDRPGAQKVGIRDFFSGRTKAVAAGSRWLHTSEIWRQSKLAAIRQSKDDPSSVRRLDDAMKLLLVNQLAGVPNVCQPNEKTLPDELIRRLLIEFRAIFHCPRTTPFR
jgi:hypothetical protein